MNAPIARSRLGLGLAPLLLLGGCALFGGGDKADLYRFGMAAPAAPAAAPAEAAQERIVFFPGASFAPAVRGDRILTFDGNHGAYVARARWVASAEELFDAAAVQWFEQAAPQVRLTRTELPGTAYRLGIEVRRFEAVYANGPKAAPEVLIGGVVTLKRWPDGRMVGEWPVEAREPAGENRVPAIVAAFDRGTRAICEQVVQHVRDAPVAAPRV